MKKYALIFIPALLTIGCASKKIVDPCKTKKKLCLTECKVKHPTQEGMEYKGCVAKCYTIYSGCKLKEGAKEGYEKTKELIH